MTKVLQVQEIEADTLKEWFVSLQSQMQGLKKHLQPKQPTEYQSRKDVAEMLGVSLVTVSEWTKKGLLKSYKIGNRVYYKRNEVENSLTEIKHR